MNEEDMVAQDAIISFRPGGRVIVDGKLAGYILDSETDDEGTTVTYEITDPDVAATIRGPQGFAGSIDGDHATLRVPKTSIVDLFQRGT